MSSSGSPLATAQPPFASDAMTPPYKPLTVHSSSQMKAPPLMQDDTKSSTESSSAAAKNSHQQHNPLNGSGGNNTNNTSSNFAIGSSPSSEHLLMNPQHHPLSQSCSRDGAGEEDDHEPASKESPQWREWKLRSLLSDSRAFGLLAKKKKALRHAQREREEQDAKTRPQGESILIRAGHRPSLHTVQPEMMSGKRRSTTTATHGAEAAAVARIVHSNDEPEQMVPRSGYDRLNAHARNEKISFAKELVQLRQQLIRMEAEKERQTHTAANLQMQLSYIVNTGLMPPATMSDGGTGSAVASPWGSWRGAWRKGDGTVVVTPSSPTRRAVMSSEIGGGGGNPLHPLLSADALTTNIVSPVMPTNPQTSATSNAFLVGNQDVTSQQHQQDATATANLTRASFDQRMAQRKEISDQFIFCQKIAIDEFAPSLTAATALKEQQAEYERALLAQEEAFASHMETLRSFYEDQCRMLQRDVEHAKAELAISRKTAAVEAEHARAHEANKCAEKIDKLRTQTGKMEKQVEEQRAQIEHLKEILKERDSIVSRQAAQLSRFQTEVTQISKERQEMKATLAALANEQMPWHAQKLMEAQRVETVSHHHGSSHLYAASSSASTLHNNSNIIRNPLNGSSDSQHQQRRPGSASSITAISSSVRFVPSFGAECSSGETFTPKRPTAAMASSSAGGSGQRGSARRSKA